MPSVNPTRIESGGGGGDPTADLAGYALAYSVDFATAATQNLLTGGDAVKTIDGVAWDALGTGNLSALNVGAPSAGLLAVHNANNPASWGFGISAKLKDLNADLNPNDDILAMLVVGNVGAAQYETHGLRLLAANSLAYATGTVYAAGMGVGSNNGRVYIERGAGAPSQESPPNGMTSAENPNVFAVELRNGLMRASLADPGNNDMPTTRDGFAIVGGYEIYGSALSHDAPQDNAGTDNARLQLCSFAGNIAATFSPLWRKLSIWHRK